MSSIDAELRDLLHDRPDLFRLAIAVAETQPRHRRGRVLAIVAAAAAIAVGIALVSSWPHGAPSVVDRALAAISTGPVIHAVVERSSADNVVVDLATGKTRERVHAIEYWYDGERSLLHTRLLTDGQMLTEIVETPTGSDSDLGHYPGGIAAQLDPALAGFVTRYRAALESGGAKLVSRAGNRTTIRFRLSPATTEDVEVDSDSYRPLAFTFSQQGRVMQSWRVASIEAVGREPAFFAKPKRAEPRPTGGGEISSRDITPEEAGNALEHPAAWVGPSLRDLPLTRTILSTDKADYTDGTTQEGKRLLLLYGENDALVIGEASSVTGSYQLGFNDGGDPPAPEGMLVLENQRRAWIGKIVRDGLYVQLRAADRDLVVAAARALTEMP